jgi:hypothetical protein
MFRKPAKFLVALPLVVTMFLSARLSAAGHSLDSSRR